MIAHHRAAAYRIGPTRELQARRVRRRSPTQPRARTRARDSSERCRSAARALEIAGAPLERARALEAIGHASFVTFDGSAAWEALREAADIVPRETPGDRVRLASSADSR